MTGYDQQHLVTYLRLLDADADGADWQEVAKNVLHIDPEREPDRAKRAWESHLARAKWLTENGYRHLLRGGCASLNLFPYGVCKASFTQRPRPVFRN